MGLKCLSGTLKLKDNTYTSNICTDITQLFPFVVIGSLDWLSNKQIVSPMFAIIYPAEPHTFSVLSIVLKNPKTMRLF